MLAAVIVGSSGQIISPGSCPENVKSVDDLDVQKYLGTWYEYAKYPVYFEAEGKCVTAKYSLKADGTVNVENSLLNEK